MIDGQDNLEICDRLITSRDVCKLVSCTDRTLRRWVATSDFPPPDRRIGKALRWRLSTVRKFIER